MDSLNFALNASSSTAFAAPCPAMSLLIPPVGTTSGTLWLKKQASNVLVPLPEACSTLYDACDLHAKVAHTIFLHHADELQVVRDKHAKKTA